jgi:hypothetical protein
VGPDLLDQGVVPGAGSASSRTAPVDWAAVRLAAERAHIFEVVGRGGSVTFARELLDQVEQMIEERVEQL